MLLNLIHSVRCGCGTIHSTDSRIRMTRRLRAFRGRRFKNHQNLENKACQELLKEVWCLDWNYSPVNSGVPPDPYLIHWKNSVNAANEFANDPDLSLSDRGVAIGLVNILRAKLDEHPSAIEEHFRSSCPVAATTTPTSTPPQLTNEQARAALIFARTLWLHASPDLMSATSSFRAAVQGCVPPRTDPANISGLLSPDFCAKHLSRTGGFSIVRTDRIERHLNSYKGTIEVFCNSSMLLALQQDPQK